MTTFEEKALTYEQVAEYHRMQYRITFHHPGAYADGWTPGKKLVKLEDAQAEILARDKLIECLNKTIQHLKTVVTDKEKAREEAVERTNELASRVFKTLKILNRENHGDKNEQK